MRFLFGTRPYLGHFFPMVPLARELLLRGHRTLVASSSEVSAAVAEAGLEFVSSGVHPDTPLPDVSGPARSPGYSDEVHRRKIVDLMSSERPDVVVREPTDIATAITAEVLGVPSVVLGRSHYIGAEAWRRVLNGDLDSLRASFGLGPDPSLRSLFGDVYLDGVPPWFYRQPPDCESYRAVDLGQYDGVSREPMLRYPPMPYAYVTLGTVYYGDYEFYRIAVQAAERNGLGMVIGAGSEAAAATMTGSAGENCIVHAFVPQSQILCGARLVLCHGGYSTVLGALRASVPLICVPHGSDHEVNASQCETLGVGLRVNRADWTVPHASRLVARMLADSAPVERARSIAQAKTVHAGLGEVAQLLEELPDLRAAGEKPTTRLDHLVAGARGHRSVNRIGWQQLSIGRSASSQPVQQLAHDTARLALDPQGWLPWSEIATVLCLAGGGGQQGPLFAASGCTVVVADISTEQLRRDREAAAAHGVLVETIEIDMCDLGALGDRQFDLVYQPVSSCYVSDVGRMFDQVAQHLRPSGWYWSQHYCPTHLQLDPDWPWDGEAYRISRPLIEGDQVEWRSADDRITINHYMHGVGALAGGICDAGFLIQRLTEEGPAVMDGPGRAGHLAAHLRPFLTVLAQRAPR